MNVIKASQGIFQDSCCLVTGGAGFIGSNLVRFLLACGAHVAVIDNMATGSAAHLPRDPRLTVFERDICSAAALRSVTQADYVFHLAAQVGNVKSLEKPLVDARNNILGTVSVLQACRTWNTRKIVYSSSSAIFGEAESLPVGETHPQRPASFYALSKQTGEQYSLLANSLWQVPAVCLRYFNVYGLPAEDNEYTGVISIFMRALEGDGALTIYGDGQQSRDFVYVQDVVQALARAAASATPGEVFNIGTGRATTITDLAQTLCRISGKNPEIHYRDSRSGEVRHSVADITKARGELGYEPEYTLDEGLREMWSASPGLNLHA